MFELFTNPDTFFQRKISEKQEFRTPIIIIGLVWLAGLFKLALLFSLVPDIPTDIIFPMLIIMAMALIIGLIGNFFMWLFCGGIFYLTSAAFRGEGSFSRVLEFSAYGFIPYIIDTTVSSIYSWRLLSSIDMLSIFESMDANSDPSILINELLFSDPAGTVIFTIFSIIMLCLSAYIWIYGMKYARNLSLKRSALTVGIPLAVYVIYDSLMFLLLFV